MSESEIYRWWPTFPAHLYRPGGMYIVTAAMVEKQHFLHSPQRLDRVLEELFRQAEKFNWQLEAWAVMANHYHFVAMAPDDADSLTYFLMALHSLTSRELNRMDQVTGRKVWHQYRDTCITNERSYLARLNYVHNNPVKHGVVEKAEDYPWCSMRWLLEKADPTEIRRALSTPCDRISIHDDF